MKNKKPAGSLNLEKRVVLSYFLYCFVKQYKKYDKTNLFLNSNYRMGFLFIYLIKNFANLIHEIISFIKDFANLIHEIISFIKDFKNVIREIIYNIKDFKNLIREIVYDINNFAKHETGFLFLVF